MALTEWSIIQRFFQRDSLRKDVVLGVGDDGAVLNPPAGYSLVITTDTLVSDVHFFAHTSPADIGYKALAVNLSDLAAMGAQPAWYTLNLTLPDSDEVWLSEFSSGLLSLSDRYTIDLVGGDTTQGPLSITITAYGFVAAQKSLLRHSAMVGDLIYVTGTLGDAGMAVSELQAGKSQAKILKPILTRLLRPSPRVYAGVQLVGVAHAAIDISDGFAADLQHILTASGVGAVLNVERLPLSQSLRAATDLRQALQWALTGGDDYELCFTVAQHNESVLQQRFARLDCPITCVGKIEAQPGLRLQNNQGDVVDFATQGWEHFT